jgi:hypothetical protein
LFVDAEDLRKALAELMPRDVPDDEVEATIRRHGGYRVERLLGQLGRAALKWMTQGRWPKAARQQYWLDMYSWQKLRQRPR